MPAACKTDPPPVIQGLSQSEYNALAPARIVCHPAFTRSPIDKNGLHISPLASVNLDLVAAALQGLDPFITEAVGFDLNAVRKILVVIPRQTDDTLDVHE